MTDVNQRNYRVKPGDMIIVQTPQYGFDNCRALVKVVHNKLEGTLGVRILVEDVPIKERLANPISNDGKYIPFTVRDGEWIMFSEYDPSLYFPGGASR